MSRSDVRESDKMSENSVQIKKSVKKTLYSAFPDQKNEKTMSRLSTMQARAQLDALKRFIQSMEAEVVDKKRIA